MSASVRASDKGGPRPENQLKRIELRGARNGLFAALIVVAVLALTGGIARRTGLGLAVLAGTTQALAAVLIGIHHRHARLAAALAASVLVVFAAIQLMRFGPISWLYPAVFGVGVLELLLVAGSTPRKPARRSHRFGRR